MGLYKVAQGWFELTLDCPRWGGWDRVTSGHITLTHPRVKGLADLCDQTNGVPKAVGGCNGLG